MKEELSKKLIESARQRLAYTEELLNRLATVKNVIPVIQTIREQTEWEIKTLENMPEEATDFFSPTVLDEYSSSSEFLMTNIPMPPRYEINPVYGTASITTSGSSVLYTSAYRAIEVRGPISLGDWAKNTVAEYRELQAKQSRYEQVRELLGKFKTDRVKELDTAYQAYKSAIADVGERVAAGISIRNLHGHFKGDLYEKARTQHRENMTWERMAIRLARGGEGSAEHTELLNQNHNWESLQTRLTEVAKGQKSGIVADLDDIWTKFLDYMFIVLGLVVVEN